MVLNFNPLLIVFIVIAILVLFIILKGSYKFIENLKEGSWKNKFYKMLGYFLFMVGILFLIEGYVTTFFGPVSSVMGGPKPTTEMIIKIIGFGLIILAIGILLIIFGVHYIKKNKKIKE